MNEQAGKDKRVSCDLEKDLLSGYLDGELEASQKDAVERHIAVCSACLRELGELKGAVTDLKSLKRASAPPEVAAVVARHTASPTRIMGRWLRMSVAAAAVALFTVSLVIIVRQETPAPAAPGLVASLEDKEVGSGKKAANDAYESKNRKALEKKKDGAPIESETALRDLDSKAPPPAAPSPAPGAAEPRRGAGAKEEGQSDLVEKAEAEGSESQDDAEDRRGLTFGAPPAPPPVMTVSSREIATVRTEIEALLLKLGLTPKAGAKELGDEDRVKDDYLTVELTDAELEDVRKRVEELKARSAMTPLEKEKVRLKAMLALEKAKADEKADTGRVARGDEAPKQAESEARPSKKGGESGAERSRGSTRPQRKRVILRFTDEPLPEPKPPAAEKK